MDNNKEEFHILGPKARGVQITFHITDRLIPEKKILWANNIKYNIQLSPDFGDYALRILCKYTDLYQMCNLLGFNSNEILDFIIKLNNVLVSTIVSSIDLSDLEDLQKTKKNKIVISIQDEIKQKLISVIDSQIKALKSKT